MSSTDIKEICCVAICCFMVAVVFGQFCSCTETVEQIKVEQIRAGVSK